MAPCSDLSFYKPTGSVPKDRIASAHMEIPQFFCPSTFDLSFAGSAEDIRKKVLFVDITAKDPTYLEGKHLAMLINNRHIEFYDDYEKVQIKNQTDLMWMPINSRTQMSSMVTFKHHEFYKKESEFDQY